MADTTCSKCNVGWVIYAQDKHCGYCGCKLFGFSVKWQEEPLLYAAGGTDIHDLTILVENTGAHPITFHPIGTTRENSIKFPDGNNFFEIKAGRCRTIPLQVKLTDLTPHHETITVRAQDVPANPDSAQSINLRVFPRPNFKLAPNPITVQYRKETEKIIKDLYLEVQEGQFHITAIKSDHGLVRRIAHSNRLHAADSADKKVSLEIDCSQLSDEPNEVTLSFDILGISTPIKETIWLEKDILPEPAKLLVQNLNLEVTEGRKEETVLTLQNSGELPLTINNIAFSPLSDFVQVLNAEYPIKIEGETHHNIDILVSAEDVAPKTYPINATVHSNCETAPQYQVNLNISVKEQETYPYYLAIDFGTTNSCCAYIGTTGVPELIPLDTKISPPEIMPSLIVYHSAPTNKGRYSIGYDAVNYQTSQIDGPYYITSVKRWLGYQWKRHFPANLEFQPRDVVAHILQHIIEQAENYLDSLKAPSKINRCVISHPTLFSSQQRADLKKACEQIGISDIKLIDEASAASLGVIHKIALPETYRLLVYDFGGGTIDIGLSEIIRDDGEIVIEPLAHGGNPRYGGDDVTQAIVDLVLDEFRQRVKKRNPNLPFEIPYTNMREVWQSSGDPEIDKATRQNTRILYDGAEEIKKELSRQDESYHYFPLRIAVGNDIELIENYTEGDVTVAISVEQLKSLIENEISQTFEDIDAMIKETGGDLPAVVILAGQSSKMCIVKNMMTNHFQTKYQTDIDIHISESPKECVAIGAAQYGMTFSSPSEDRIEIVNAFKTYSRLGILQVKGGKQVFREIIPKGRLIPDDSHNTIDFPLNDRLVVIDVREHFGTDNELSNTSPVDNYTLRLPAAVKTAFLRKARLQMAVDKTGEIALTALVNADEYRFTVKKREPEFVNEI